MTGTAVAAAGEPDLLRTLTAALVAAGDRSGAGSPADGEPGARPAPRASRRRSLRCAVGWHRTHYAGVRLGQSLEACERCRLLRVAR